ncbi:DUF6517 family protein [Halobacterium zhouii]|uniref:DUF6517 family protein n=1 Tax=Halobacterium zhouii TaxID=2902624 RepID=UPI001E4BD21B|nr:DUF6517 family protein [Halobacterium zhouii]
MRRRTFLGTAGIAGLGALAGCSTAAGSVAPPSIPEQALSDGGWKQTDRTEQTVFEKSYGPMTVTGKSTTLTYTDAELAKSVEEKTLGRIQGDLAIFAASHINFSPDLNNLPAAIGRKEVLNRTETAARDQFEARMRDAGLVEVTKTGEQDFETDSGATASLTTYESSFPVEEMTYDAGGKTLTLDVDAISVAGDLAVWNEGDYVVVAGGAYPAENVAKTTTKQLSEAISVTVNIDLGLTPEAYREEVRGLVATTE